MRSILLSAAVLFSLAPQASAQVYAPTSSDSVAVVDSWYRTYLGRAATEDIYSNDWVNQLDRGATREAVLSGILGSDEYFQRCGGTPQGFVSALFRDVVGRQPTPSEYDFWTRRAFLVDRKDIAYQVLTQNPGWVTVAPATPPATVIIQGRDRNWERERERAGEREREEWRRHHEHEEHDYRRPYYPFRR